MPTTPRGYHYPAGTDAPAGPAQMQTLATDIDTDVATVANPPRAKIADTGNAAGRTPTNVSDNQTTFGWQFWNKTVFAVGGMTGDATGIVVPVAGDYQINGAAQYGTSGSGRRAVWVMVNGAELSPSEHSAVNGSTDGNIWVTVSTLCRLNAGDRVNILMYQDSGGVLPLNGANLSVFLVGRT